MPNIASSPYSSIVANIPVLGHTIKVKCDIWKGLIPLTGLRHPILSGQTSYEISRKKLLNHSYSTKEEKCLEILMWGYSSGGRGTNISAALSNLRAIAVAASACCGTWSQFYAGFPRGSRIGISTATKIAYFFHCSFSGSRALILDEQIAKVINSGRWGSQLSQVGGSRSQWATNYPAYLNEMNVLAASISAKPDQVELFLYLMGPHFR